MTIRAPDPASSRQSAPSGRARTRARTRRAGARSRRARRCAPRRSAGPSMPGMRSGRIDGTAGTQFATAEAGLAQERDVRRVVVRELHLPDADPVEPGRCVGADVLRERRVRPSRSRRARASSPDPGTFASSAPRQRRLRELLVDEVARSRRRARARDACDAPMCQRPSTAVLCPGACGSGRKRKFWSSAHEPP